MLGQDDRLAARRIGDVTNLFIDVTRRELAHGKHSDWKFHNIQIPYIARKALKSGVSHARPRYPMAM